MADGNSVQAMEDTQNSIIAEEEMMQEYYSKYCPSPDLIEDLEMYTPDGLHPVQLRDCFQDRYTIIHKLGYGGSSTVWLAHDSTDKRYVAIKIVAACMSELAASEASVHKKVQASVGKGVLDAFLVSLLDEFWIDGPNGRHICLVTAVCGPSLASFRQGRTMKIRPDIVSVLGKQVADGLLQLHQVNLIYGDLSAGNVVFALDNLDDRSVEEVLDILGKPVEYPVQTARDADAEWGQKHGPATVYDSVDFTNGSQLHLLKPEIRLIDLGSAYFSPKTDQLEGRAFTESYTDPSCLVKGDDTTKESDVWGLACVLFEMRSATCLFEDRSMGVFSEMIDRIGPLPASFEIEDGVNIEELGIDIHPGAVEANPVSPTTKRQSKRESLFMAVNKLSGVKKIMHACRSVFSWISKRSVTRSKPSPRKRFEWLGDDLTLHGQIKNIGNWHPWHKLTIEQRREILDKLNATFADDFPRKIDTSDKALDRGPPPPQALSIEEAADFEDLLSKMLTWERDARLKVDQVVAHPWFSKKYPADEEEGPWLQEYYRGAGYEKNGVVFI